MKKNAPMYFLSLEVENIRCFAEKQTLDLSNGDGKPAMWTLILGDNGVGKTTLLQCLTWMRTVKEPEEGIDNYPKHLENAIREKMKHFKDGKRELVKPIMDDLDDNTEIEALLRDGRDLTSIIIGKYSVNSGKNSISVEVGMKFRQIKGSLAEVNPIPDCIAILREPNLIAYSASRHMTERNIDRFELRDPVANLFSDAADLFDAEQVLNDLDHKALQEKEGSGKATLLLESVKQLLVDLLPDVENADAIQILGPKGYGDDDKKSGVLVRTPYGSVSLSALSLGYKTMLAWAVDLALRLLWSNPKSKAPLKEHAIVIIDEIDLHLHPKWQRMLRVFLCKNFPNVQFICTAHSPFMAQEAEEENLVILQRNGNHIIIESDPAIVQGWRVDQVASNLMGVSSVRSTEVEKLINERRAILGKRKPSPKDKARLALLDEKIAGLPTTDLNEDNASGNLIREAAELIRKNKEG